MPVKVESPGRLYSVQQAALMLGSESKVYRYLRSGKLTSYIVNDRRMITAESIRAALKAGS